MALALPERNESWNHHRMKRKTTAKQDDDSSFDFSPIPPCPLGCECGRHEQGDGTYKWRPLTDRAVLAFRGAANAAIARPTFAETKVDDTETNDDFSKCFERNIDLNASLYVQRLREAVRIKSVSAEAESRNAVVSMIFWTKRWCVNLDKI